MAGDLPPAPADGRIAWLVAGGNHKVRYRGIAKNNAWLHTRTAALNLRGLLHPRPGAPRRTWALA